MNFINNIPITEFDAFVISHPYSHYMKTSAWGFYKQETENMIPHFVGLKQKNQLQATALILQKKIGPFSYFYIPWGMCVEYTNISLTTTFLKEIKKYVRTFNSIFLRIDLNVKRNNHKLNGEIIDDGFNQEYVTEYFKENGFKHKGYGYAYNGSWVNRFTLIKDLSEPLDQLVTKMDRNKKILYKTYEEKGIETKQGSINDLHYVSEFEKQLTKTQGFKPKSIAFFNTLFEHLKPYIQLYITTLHTKQYIKFIETQLNSKNIQNDPKAILAKENELIKAKQLNQQYGDSIVLAVGVFVKLNDKSWDLYTYNNKNFAYLRSPDILHLNVMQKMQEQGVTSYDFVGFSGETKESDPYYGLYVFKSKFLPEYTEYLGEFDDIIQPGLYKLYIKSLKQIKRVKRKYFALKYKKISN